MKIGLRLYVTKNSSFCRSAQEEIQKLHALCPDVEFDLDVIDVVESPLLAETEEITATPTLVKFNPPPIRKIVCDFSDLAKRLGLRTKDESSDKSNCAPHDDVSIKTE